MKIYVDFDDCLCETAKYFTKILDEMFGKNVPYENIKYFDLQKSFSINDEQYEQMMIEGHRPEVLLSFEETPGASETLNEWVDRGYDVSIITGRPFSSYEPSKHWLDQHGLERVRLYCLDKYGRDAFIKNSTFSLELDDYYKMKFDYAIEDSPKAFRFFDHLPDMKVMVFDRPWNRDYQLPGDNYSRCLNWESIKSNVN